jgi:flagellar biosynthesis protein FlhG
VLSFAAMSQERLVVLTPEPTSLTDSYALIKILATEHGVKNFQVIVNMTDSLHEARQTFDRLFAACHHFLGIKIQYLGLVHQDKAVTESVRRQEPLVQWAQRSPAARDIQSLAQSLHKQRSLLAHLIAQSPVLRTSFGAP